MRWKHHLLSVHIAFDRANITSGVDGSDEQSKQGGLDPSSYKPASMAALEAHSVRFIQKCYGTRPPFHVPVVGAGQTNQFLLQVLPVCQTGPCKLGTWRSREEATSEKYVLSSA